MPELVERVIAGLARTGEDDADVEYLAEEILLQYQCQGYKSDRVEVASIAISADDAERVRRAINAALADPRNEWRAGTLVWALYKVGARSEEEEVIRSWLQRSVSKLAKANGTMFQCLLALDAFEPSASGDPGGHAINEVDRNLAAARQYLRRFGVTIPW